MSKGSRMFLINGKPMKTWNVFVGCRHDCVYCNARRAAATRFHHIRRYRDGFEPKLVPEELGRVFRPNEFVFVAYMGDIAFAPRLAVVQILAQVRQYPETSFLFLTKNPAVYNQWRSLYPHNLYLGTTIETNRDYGVSRAPTPRKRVEAMLTLAHPRKFVSIEPIMDFDLVEMLAWMYLIDPKIIEIGADNYHNHLPEPEPTKVSSLTNILSQRFPIVVEKPGLERLKKMKGGNTR